LPSLADLKKSGEPGELHLGVLVLDNQIPQTQSAFTGWSGTLEIWNTESKDNWSKRCNTDSVKSKDLNSEDISFRNITFAIFLDK